MCAVGLMSTATRAQTFTDLTNFDVTNGAYPIYGSQALGANGNLYGTTNYGGAAGGGTVFEITPTGELTTLHNFCSQDECSDGYEPYGGLVLAPDGNFYGTTAYGGASGYGTVFQITPEGTLTTIYSFCPGYSCVGTGGYPESPLAVSKGGLLYGTTSAPSTLFSITTSGVLTTLYTFCSQPSCVDGSGVYGPLVVASNGTIYGTTLNGGASSWGTVFLLTETGKFSTLHSFAYTDGSSPAGGLVQGKNGTLYGTTSAGGKANGGTIFQIAKGNKFSTIYNFCAKTYCADGAVPYAGLMQGKNGNLFGTTNVGGAKGWGTVFEITTAGVLTTLHTFSETDGSYPYQGVVENASGDVFGTTYEGGDLSCVPAPYGCGTVFSIAP
jgi:uncharacterized repeat protein (TIGR03803 family)